MRIVKFAERGNAVERVGLWVGDDRIIDLTDHYGSLPPLLEAVSAGELDGGVLPDEPKRELADLRLLAPRSIENKVLCVALNYRPHADENKVTHPERPILFLKTAEALINPGDEIHKPSLTSFLDYEAGLAVFIGRTAKNVQPAAVYDHLAGYTLFNDVTGRDLVHVKSGERTRNDYFSAKCLDHTTPLGPAIVTKDEFGDPTKATLKGTLNGAVVQEESVSALIVSIPELVSYASQRSTLRPGDIIATGTPGGVGRARGRALAHGDTFTVECGCIPALVNVVRAV